MESVALLIVVVCIPPTGLENTFVDGKSMENAAVLEGQQTRIRCGGSWAHSVELYRRAVGCTDQSNDVLLFRKEVSSPGKYEMNRTDSNQWRFVILSTERSDAGTYICNTVPRTTPSNKELNQYMELSVLSTAVCTDNSMNGSFKENQQVLMLCIVEFRGNLVPSVDWTYANGNASVDKDRVNTRTFFNNNITSQLTIVADFESRNRKYCLGTYFKQSTHEGHSIVCPRTKNCSIATNVPSFSHTSCFPALNILYGPTNLRMSSVNIDSVYTLTCHADANPEATYEWRNLTSGKIISNHSKLVLEGMSDNNQHIFQCTARNIFNNASDKIAFTTSTKEKLTITLTVGSVSGGVVLLCLAIIITICITKHNRAQRKAAIEVENRVEITEQTTMPTLEQGSEKSDDSMGEYAEVVDSEEGGSRGNYIELDRYDRESTGPSVYARIKKNSKKLNYCHEYGNTPVLSVTT